jgi:hypothetical protein
LINGQPESELFMNNHQSTSVTDQNGIESLSCLSHSLIVRRPIVARAAARLVAAAERRNNKTIRAEYYGGGRGEEVVGDIVCRGALNGLITRNHYGCLVLNAAHTLFIDVDVTSHDKLPDADGGGSNYQPWQRVLDDLCTVLASETDESFRIYRTAAGFRVLATRNEYDPTSADSAELMHAAGADCDFVSLCRIQSSFRARLSPKPWRCGMRRPPNLFPRHTAGEQRRFAEWLSRYAAVCSDRATCRYLGRVGDDFIHPHIAPIVELHDRATRAHVPLALA